MKKLFKVGDRIRCKCIEGNLEEFETRVKETHKNNKQYLNEYLSAIEFFKSLSVK